MAQSIGGPTGVLVTQADKVGNYKTLDEYCDANGITDKALFKKMYDRFWNKDNWEPGKSWLTNALDFLNTLTPDQLQEKTAFGFYGGRTCTYADIKQYVSASKALEDVMEALPPTTNNNDLTRSDAGPVDVERVYIANLMTKIGYNQPGAYDEARRFLSAVRSPQDIVSLSSEAVQRLVKDENTYLAAHPSGNWDADQTADSSPPEPDPYLTAGAASATQRQESGSGFNPLRSMPGGAIPSVQSTGRTTGPEQSELQLLADAMKKANDAAEAGPDSDQQQRFDMKV